MEDTKTGNDDLSAGRTDELEPQVLAKVTDVTGVSGSGNGDFDNIVWSME